MDGLDGYPAPYRWFAALWRWVVRVTRVERWWPDRGIGDRPGYHLVNGDPPPVHTPPDGPGPPVDLPADPTAFMLANVDQFPHCDSRILHAPGQCEFCDSRPEWQALRIAWGIAFTGQPTDGSRALLPCPADYARPPGSPSDHRKWYGNVPAGT